MTDLRALIEAYLLDHGWQKIEQEQEGWPDRWTRPEFKGWWKPSGDDRVVTLDQAVASQHYYEEHGAW